MMNEKKGLLYEAVLELMHEKPDISSIKVAEIAARANMGKSTVYEYFDSKEQLIVEAIISICLLGAQELKKAIEQEVCFKEAYLCMLGYVGKMINKHQTLIEYLTKSEFTFPLQLKTQQRMQSQLEDIRQAYMGLFQQLIDRGVIEGVIAPSPAMYDWYTAILSSVTCLFVHNQGFNEFADLTTEEVQEKAYAMFVKLLN